MNKIEDIEKLLETSHQRGRRETVPEVEALMAKLRDGTWRRHARRVANLQMFLIVGAIAMLSAAWIPSPEYKSYTCTSAEVSPEDDCRALHELLSRP